MTPEEVEEHMVQAGVKSLAHITVGGSHQYYVTLDQVRKIAGRTEIKILSTEIQSLPSIRMKKPEKNAAYKRSP